MEREKDSVSTLVRDLTSRLADIASEFSRRAEKVAAPEADRPPDDAELVDRARRLLAERRKRTSFLPPELFHEPAWDMLLTLYVAQHENRIMNVKTLVGHSDAPATTSQRWIEHLAKLQLIHRIVDMVDRRRIEVQLSTSGEEAMRSLLTALR